MSAWAKHFRSHYCNDDDLDELLVGTYKTRAEYLRDLKFPDCKKKPGPSIRSGDFGEILVADFLEYIEGYWVPRTRYVNKTIRNESVKGSDMIGFKYKTDHTTVSDDDEMIIFEAKAQLSGKKAKGKLNEAIKDSAKDKERLAESLNAMKQQLRKEDKELANRISRFQSRPDVPYKEVFGAAAIFSTEVFDTPTIISTTKSKHDAGLNARLLIIHGINMMDLAHKLYDIACDEA